MLMWVSPLPPGAQLQVRSLVFLDQQVRLTGFSGGTGMDGKEEGREDNGPVKREETMEGENVGSSREQRVLQSSSPAGDVPLKWVFFS